MTRKGWIGVVCALGAVVVGAFFLTKCRGGTSTSSNNAGELVIASYGGAWQEAQLKAMFSPFEAATGISVNDVVYDGQYAVVKEMVRSGNVEWDVVDVEGNMVILGARDDLVLEIDKSALPTDEILPEAILDHGVGIVAWSWVLAFRDGSLSDEQMLDPWKTFFDTDAIPGNRGLRDDPRRVLEIALMADGVPMGELYPLDLDRAFRVLSGFRQRLNDAGHTIVWWDAQARAPQLIDDEEVVLTPAANGRVAAARDAGANVTFTWRQGIVDLDWWIVLRGTSNRDAAMQFIGFASSAEAQAAIAQEIPYGPVNTRALDLIPEDVRRSLPTHPDNLAQQMWFGTQWWAENGDAVVKRWAAWRAGSN